MVPGGNSVRSGGAAVATARAWTPAIGSAEPALAAQERRRAFSYVDEADPPLRRHLIRSIEQITGRTRLVRRARAFLEENAEAAAFWANLPRAAGVELRLDGAPIEALPATGPLVVVANHPFGVFDGIMLGSVVARLRSDFLLMINARLRPVPQVAHQWLPIDVEDGTQSFKRRAAPMLRALRHLRAGGCVVMFPAGAVATTPRLLARRAHELPWAEGLGLLLKGSGAGVLPVYFHGQNSPLFQVASHVSTNLRLGLLLLESMRRLDRPRRVTVGRPLRHDELPLDDPALPARLRDLTLALGAPAGSRGS